MTIYLIRYGEAAKAWDEDLNPALSIAGHRQAKAAKKKYCFDLNIKNVILHYIYSN